jgi:hypothetical protein
MGGDAITEMARQLVRKHPTHPARSLARRLVQEANGAITLEQARYRIRAQFGQSGKRGKPAAKRAARKPGQGVEMPPSKAEKWEPYVLETTGIVGILSDIHVPFHSEVALQAAVGHLKTVGIDALVLNGDTCDFYTISRWIKEPKETRLSRRDQRRDAAAGVATARVSGRADHLQKRQPRGKVAALAVAARTGDFRRPTHGPRSVAGTRGARHRTGRGPAADHVRCFAGLARPRKRQRHLSPVNQARGAFLRLLHTVLEGHGHRTSGHAESDMWHRETFCWSTGCLCDLTPEYARVNRWNWGFATVTVDTAGSFDVDNYRISAKGEIRSS